MTRRFAIPFVGVLASFGFAQPTFGDHTCAQFTVPIIQRTACFSRLSGTFCRQLAEQFGGVIMLDAVCTWDGFDGTCLSKDPGDGGPDPICSDNLDDVSEGLCGTLRAATCPTVSEWGMAVMALLVITTGTIVFARRRAMLST